jgi:predicted porin
MQKKIIAVAVAAALATPGLAFAAGAFDGNVTVYGKARVSYDLFDNGDGTTTANGAVAANGISSNKVSSNSSRLGFKGNERISDDLKVVWQIESLVNFDNAVGNSLGTRNTFAGLSSKNLGTLRLGRYDTPYKTSTGRLDLFRDTLADSRALTGSVGGRSAQITFDGRQPDSVSYTSPSFNGFKVDAFYVAGAEAAITSGQVKGDIWSFSGTYDNGSLYGALAHEIHNFGSVGTGTLAGTAGNFPADSEEKATKVGVGYKIDALTLGFAYETSSDNGTAVTGADRFGHNTYFLSGKYKFGSDAIKLTYTKAGDLGSAVNSDATMYAIGYDHGLSKRTSLYVTYAALNNSNGINYTFSGNGTGTAAAAGFGAKVTALSLGMNHSF